MEGTVYTSRSLLRSPRLFRRQVVLDFGVIYHVGWRLFVRNLTIQARQSLFGSAAMLLPPLIAGLVWIFLGQAKVINVPTGGVPYPLYVLTGMFIWQHFVEAFNCPLLQLVSARATLARVRVPHEAFVAAGAAVVMMNTVIRVAILAGLLLWFHVPFTAAFALAPLGLLVLLALGVTLGWIVAPLGLLYADMPSILALVLNLWFLVTPVVYTLPAGANRWLNLNPVTPLLLTIRNWMLAGPVSPTPFFWLVTVLSVLLLIGSWLGYRVAQTHLIERL